MRIIKCDMCGKEITDCPSATAFICYNDKARNLLQRRNKMYELCVDCADGAEEYFEDGAKGDEC